MVFLLGTTNKEYLLEGVLLPKKAYSDREVELGKKAVVKIDDLMYARLGANKIFQGLVKDGTILVRDKEPEGMESPAELRDKVRSVKDEAAATITKLTAEIQSLKDELATIKKEALTEIDERDARIKELEELLA